MGNISYNTFRGNMSDQRLTKALEQISTDRFKGLIAVTPRADKNGEIWSWTMAPRENLLKEVKSPWGLRWTIYKYSNRRFGGKYPPCEWAKWMQWVFQAELSNRFNGWISDEGIGESWKGDPTKYPTFRDWVREMWGGVLGVPGIGFAFYKRSLKEVPRELRKI